MRPIADAIGLATVEKVVDAFYAAIRQHPTLAGPFGRVTDWPEHLRHLSHFWWVTLGGKRYLDYRYNVPERHAAAGFTPELLQDWLALFRQTVHTHLDVDLANAWLARVERIGESLRLMHELGQFPPPPAFESVPVTTLPS
ncbi:group III truncated hemoglobin [Chitinimonas sp. BJB300]|uniref:group III truncated hemoglobin n=1 Tax=Chitinimonas sp. BJB300 TaxID=1559339 RepID=UPI001112295F|nr:group III truncated hemoglobin [Chitinimonas sp. BJB300]TSJ87476.1 group III truncated hemoglobin [Chitinimonas sp. BJB300]